MVWRLGLFRPVSLEVEVEVEGEAMKYAELKRRLREAERFDWSLRDRAEHFERETRRLIEERESFTKRTMREALAMMQRAVEYAPPQILICKCMEGEMHERFPRRRARTR